MKRNLQGMKFQGKRLRHWDIMLKAWQSLITRYCDSMENDDVPYYHTERANIGVLSGAAWKAGWLTLEEFGARKRGKLRGSCDLYIYPIDRGIGEYIEAKLVWSIEKAESGLSEALKDTRKLLDPKHEDALRVGVVFVCPSIHEKFASKVDNHIERILQVTYKVPHDALSWSFPASAREFKGGGRFEKIIYPGILLIAKVAD